MKKQWKYIVAVTVAVLLLLQTSACSVLDGLYSNHEQTSVTTSSKTKKSTTKKTTSKKKKKTTVKKTTTTSYIEEEEKPTDDIPDPEPEETEEEETEKRLTYSEIRKIRERITQEYEEKFELYEAQYKEDRQSLSDQISAINKQRNDELVEARFMAENAANSGYNSSSYYQSLVSNIESRYDSMTAPLHKQITELDNEYNTIKNNLKAIINLAIEEEIARIENEQ